MDTTEILTLVELASDLDLGKNHRLSAALPPSAVILSQIPSDAAALSFQ